MAKQKRSGFLAPPDELKVIAAGPRLGPARCSNRMRGQGGGIVGKSVDGEPARESEHFMLCPHCGQAIDMRELAQALHHDMPGHKPIRLDG